MVGSDTVLVHVSEPMHRDYVERFLSPVDSLLGLLGYIVFNIGLQFYRQGTDWQNLSEGLFQSMSIRSAGFEIVDLSYIAPALQSVLTKLLFPRVVPADERDLLTSCYLGYSTS